MMKNCEYQQIDLEALSTPAPTPSPQPVTDNGKEEEKTAKKQRRKWEVFQGKNRFCCDGRIIMARQSGVLPLTLGLILLTSVLFFIFDCPFLVQHLTVCIPVIGGALFVFVVITLVQTSFSDPGILPRATPDEAADVEKQIDDAGNTTYRPPPRTREVLINQQAVKLKYCFTCKMFRPPRTSHCSLCDNCVERFDHHCPWVGNCVGKRNYRFFYTFIVSLSFLTAFIFGCVTTHLALRAQDGKGLVFALQEMLCVALTCLCTAVELVICFFSVWSILGLSGFHTYLVASNLTTNEDIKGSWTGKSGAEAATNPYSHRNIFVNCCSVLCGPMPPSLIDRRGFLSAEEEAAAAAAPQATSREVELPVLASKKDINVGSKCVSEESPARPASRPRAPPTPPTADRRRGGGGERAGHSSAVNSDPARDHRPAGRGALRHTPAAAGDAHTHHNAKAHHKRTHRGARSALDGPGGTRAASPVVGRSSKDRRNAGSPPPLP
ncbi:unnamed protein product [Boreogadus saida]